MKNRQDTIVSNWIKTNTSFLQSQCEIDFFSTFKIPKNRNPIITDNVGMRIMGGIWFENLVLKHFQSKHQVYVFDRFTKRENTITKQLLNDQKYHVFHQPWFKYDNIITQCDFLIRNGNGFDIYEVKGVNETMTAKKRQEYFSDLAYQYWLLKKCGINVKNVYLIHLNRDYHHQTSKLDFESLIAIDNQFNTSFLKTFDLERFLPAINEYLTKSFTEIQPFLLDFDCLETKINSVSSTIRQTRLCTFLVPIIKYEHHILQMYRMLAKNKSLFYAKVISNDQLSLLNLKEFDANLFEALTKKQLSPAQNRQIAVIKNQEPIVKDITWAQNQFKQYQYPIYFYDFETTATPIPVFKDSQPYLQIPFQFSIHILEHPNQNQTELKQITFLASDRSDPRLQFTRALIKGLQKFGPGSYVAYHKAFEITILRKLLFFFASQLTSTEISTLEMIIQKTLDIKDFFCDLNIYLPQFYGSLSIKKTLPAFDNQFSYQNLTIQKGDQASALYFSFLYEITNQMEWTQNRQNLLKYCSYDTLAMVILFKKIKKLVF